MEKIYNQFTEIDQEIRAGRLTEARAELRALDLSELGNADRIRVASLFRRADLPQYALRTLQPLVLGYGRRLPKSSPEAKIEYASSLIQMDLVDEGRRFLRLPDVRDHREAKRWHALSLLHDYRLEQAAREISELLRDWDPLSYDYLVLLINLMIALLALVHDPKEKARFDEVAAEAKTLIERHQATRLAENFRSIVEQAIFFAHSSQVATIRTQEPSDYQEFAAQFTSWFHEGRAGRISRDELEIQYRRFRHLAATRQWSEGVREIDFHYARNFDPEKLSLVKMGTGLPRYQERVLGAVSMGPWHYCFERSPKEASLENAATVTALPEPPKLRRLFQILYREQYAPFSVAALWSQLAPDEHFIEPHSSDRVHQWVKRLKQWLAENQIPATVISEGTGYRLRPSRPLRCESRLLESPGPEDDLFLKIESRYRAEDFFTIAEIHALMPQLSRREVLYHLQKHLARGVIARIGLARNTRYRLANGLSSGG